MIDGRFDVVIAGGGPAGAAAALVLARRSRSVLLVDPAHAHQPRGESLPPAAWPLLTELGVADSVAAAGHLPTPGTLSAWGSPELVPRDFAGELGLQLDRPAFDTALLDHARRAGARIVPGASLIDISPLPGTAPDQPRHTVRLADGGSVTARWIIDASGRKALPSRRLGARRARDDTLTAMLAEFSSPSGDPDSRLIIEACPDGWWYCALTPSRTRIVGFLADRDLIDLRTMSTRAGFAARLAATTHIAPRLRAHDYALAGRPHTISAASGRISPWCGASWLAVGDAALALDPLSSQGIFNALYTGLRGGEAIADTLDGDATRLAAYDRHLAETRAAYLRHRTEIYAAVRRWRDQPFWRRRAGRSRAATPTP